MPENAKFDAHIKNTGEQAKEWLDRSLELSRQEFGIQC